MMKKMTIVLAALTLAACNSPSAPTPVMPSTPVVESTPVPQALPTPEPVAAYDVSIQTNPAPIYASTWNKYKWEVHGRMRIENQGELIGHFVRVELDVPGDKRDIVQEYEMIVDHCGTNVVPIAETFNCGFKLFFSWDKGFPVDTFATVWVRDQLGEMHRYGPFTWTVGD